MMKLSVMVKFQSTASTVAHLQVKEDDKVTLTICLKPLEAGGVREVQ